MNMNMKEKGRQTRLLAAIAVLAMVVCAFAVAMPSDDVDAVATPDSATGVTSEDIADATSGTFKLTENWTLNADGVIPTGVTLYTDGKTIDASGKKLTVNGVLYVNGTGGTLIISGMDDDNCVFSKVVVDTNGTVKVGTTTFIGSDGYLKVTSGTLEIADKSTSDGFTITLTENSEATLGEYSTYYLNTMTVSQGATLTVTGAVTVYGGTVSDEVITNNGTINFSGAGKISSSNVDGNGAINGYLVRTDYGSAEALEINADAIDKNITIYGTDNTDYQLVSGGSISVAEGGQYSGTVTYVYSDGRTPVECAYTQSVDLVIPTAANAINNVVTIEGNTLKIAGTMDGTNTTADVAIAGASVSDVTGTAAAISVNGVEIYGTIAAPISIPADKKAVVPNGQTLAFGNNAKITLTEGTTETALYIYGSLEKVSGVTSIKWIDNSALKTKVYCTTQNAKSVNECVTSTTNVDSNEIYSVSSQEELEKYNIPGTFVYLNADITIDKYVELNGVTIYTNGNDITVGGTTSGTLVLNNCTIDRVMANGTAASVAGEYIEVKDGSSMQVNSSLLFIEVTAGSGASIKTNNAAVSYDNTSSNVRVGYGTQFTFTGTAVEKIEVFGDLIINSTVTVENDILVTVYNGGTMTVNGSITFLGDADFRAGSEVTVAEGGKITAGDRNGTSEITANGKVTVAEGATFTVFKASNTAVSLNSLIIGGTFTVNGTMNMNGQFSGQILDKGAVTINGTAVEGGNASVKIYDGVTLTVSSVTGSMDVVDDGIVSINATLEENGTSKQSNGNKVTITDAGGITVSEAVQDVFYTVDKVSHHDYYSVMTVAGTVSEGGSITVSQSANAIDVGEDDEYSAYVLIGDEGLILLESTDLNVNGALLVSGEVTAVAENDIGISVGNGGELTVTGKITARDEIANNGILNAVYYSLAADTQITYQRHIYTNFVDANAAASSAEENTITVYGTVSASADANIADGTTVDMTRGSVIIVPAGVTVIAESGCNVDNDYAMIDVNGTFTSMNYAEDLGRGEIRADVVTVDGPSKTWTSLANAIAGSSPGDVIEANGVIIITSGLTIPEGVTVHTEYPLTVDDATLTVLGTLEMEMSAWNTVTQDGTDYSGLDVTGDDGDIVVRGVMAIETQGAAGTKYVGDDIDGAHYAIADGAIITNYVSNVAFAAQTVSGNVGLVGDVVIKGAVSAGDVEFSKGTNQNVYSIIVQNHNFADGDQVVNTMFSFGSIDIGAGITFQVTSPAMASGSVSVPCGDGETDAVIDIGRAQNVTIVSTSQPTADGTDYDVFLSGTATFAGTVTVSAGEVSLGTMTVGGSNVLTVASGAILTIPSDGALTISEADSYGTVPLVIAGTLVLQKANGIAMYYDAEDNSYATNTMSVSGTLTVDVRDAVLPTGLTTYVTGTLQVSDDYAMTVNGKLVVGIPADSLGATGVLSGNIGIAQNGAYILAYAGTDLSGAKIVWNVATNQSDALVTTYNINGFAYATVYANSDVRVDAIFGTAAGKETITLTGLDTCYNWYASAEDAERHTHSDNETDTVNSKKIGFYANVYAYFDDATVPGTISKDAGIILTIDGNVITNNGADMGGTGDQSFTTSFSLSVGTHTIAWSERSGYTFADVTVTFNGVEVENGGTITITADMQSYTIVVSGSEPSVAATGDDGMGLTDYLLIVLVILIVIMAIMVALRLMRS